MNLSLSFSHPSFLPSFETSHSQLPHIRNDASFLLFGHSFLSSRLSSFIPPLLFLFIPSLSATTFLHPLFLPSVNTSHSQLQHTCDNASSFLLFVPLFLFFIHSSSPFLIHSFPLCHYLHPSFIHSLLHHLSFTASTHL